MYTIYCNVVRIIFDKFSSPSVYKMMAPYHVSLKRFIRLFRLIWFRLFSFKMSMKLTALSCCLKKWTNLVFGGSLDLETIQQVCRIPRAIWY